MKKRPTFFVLLSFCFLIACASDVPQTTEDMNNPFSFTNQPDDSRTGFVTMQDPREGAFSVKMPQGWKAQVSLERPQGQVRPCGIAFSPDGASRIFFGDPTLPTFMLPNPNYGMYEGANTGSSMTVVQQFVNADAFFKNYVQRHYGQQTGFRITNVSPAPHLQQFVMKQAQEMGMPAPHITTATVSFEFTENGSRIQAGIHGVTLGMQGVWVADMHGYTTSGNAQEIDQIVKTVATSYKTNPQWRQQENVRNQQKMAQQQAGHQQRMNAMQQNFNSHQKMMQQRYNAADQQNQAWRQNQQYQDQQHQNYMQNQNSQSQSHDQFIDYLRDEETVTNGNQTGKVDAGSNHYYVNPNTGEYIGTDIQQNPDPSLYQHWKRKN